MNASNGVRAVRMMPMAIRTMPVPPAMPNPGMNISATSSRRPRISRMASTVWICLKKSISQVPPEPVAVKNRMSTNIPPI